MTDPLGLLGGATNRVNPAFSPRPATPGEPGEAQGPSFKDVLLKNLDEANRLQQEAATAAEDLATGKRTDVESVLLATQKADTAFRVLLAVKNRVQAAYDEMKQVRV
jgi:flagellar hook-basal body complex protein FliE